MECDYCKKTFCSNSSLSKHKKTNKACRRIQEEAGVITENNFVCPSCEKNFTAKLSLSYHITICKKNNTNLEQKVIALLDEVKQQTEHIKRLEEKIEKTPKITKIHKNTNIETNNNIETNIEQQNNITIYQIMSPEHVEDFFKKHYNLDTLLGGQKALARFVNDGFLKESPVYLCGDRSRQKFYIVKDGKKTEDTDCSEILGLTAPGMPYVQDVYETALFDLPETVTEDRVQDNYQDIMKMDEQRSDFKTELSKIVGSDTVSEKSQFKTILEALKERSKRLGLTEREH